MAVRTVIDTGRRALALLAVLAATSTLLAGGAHGTTARQIDFEVDLDVTLLEPSDDNVALAESHAWSRQHAARVVSASELVDFEWAKRRTAVSLVFHRNTPLPTSHQGLTQPLRVAQNEASSADTVSSDGSGATQAYVDQLIDDTTDDAAGGRLSPRDQTDTGRRLLTLEYNLFHRNPSRTASGTEHGALLRASQETLSYGTFRFEGRGTYNLGLQSTGDPLGEYYSLSQDEFVLTEDWQADSTIGNLSARTNPLLSSSFRYNLGSSTARGLTTTLYTEDTEIRAVAGKTGTLQGTTTRVFDEEDATLAGLGLVRVISPQWVAGVQGYMLSGDSGVADHESVVGALQFDDPTNEDNYQLHTLFDSLGNAGFWGDADTRVGRWRHRYGAFRQDPGLLWTDTPVSSDRQGLYWRADRRGFRRSFSFGTDLTETNLAKTPTLTGLVTSTSFASFSLRLNRKTSVGVFGNLGLRRSGSGRSTEAVNSYELTGFANRELPFGTARLQTSYAQSIGDITDTQRYAVTWDQSWLMPSNQRLNSTLEWTHENSAADQQFRQDAGISYRYTVTTDLSIGADLTLTSVEAQKTADQFASRVNVAMFWQPRRDWQLNLSADWNQNRLEPRNGGRSTSTDRRVFLTLRHSIASGRSPTTVGVRSGKPGTGRLIGRVFFDANRDGVWSPTEETAADVVVFLDRRYTATTRETGEYEFSPATVGEHTVIISQDNLPLPWGLDDESPRVVKINVRDTTELDFALVRLDN